MKRGGRVALGIAAGTSYGAVPGGIVGFIGGRERRQQRRFNRKMGRIERDKALAEAAFGQMETRPQLDMTGLTDYYGQLKAPGTDALGYAKGAYDFMDVPGVNKAQRAAAMGELNRGALQEAIGRRQAMQQSGVGGATSGTGLALQMAGLNNLSFNRANVESDLQQQAIDRQLAAKELALGYGQNRVGQDLSLYGQNIELAGRRGAYDYDRMMTGYEANKLAPWQDRASRQAAIAQYALGQRAARQNMAGNIIGGAAGAGTQLGAAYIGRGG